MSDCAINIRILFWHVQLTTYGKWRFSFNAWIYSNHFFTGIFKPVSVCEWDLSKRNTENLDAKCFDTVRDLIPLDKEVGEP